MFRPLLCSSSGRQNFIIQHLVSSHLQVAVRYAGEPDGHLQLSFPDFMTTTQDGGKDVSLMHRPPLPQEMHLGLISFRG